MLPLARDTVNPWRHLSTVLVGLAVASTIDPAIAVEGKVILTWRVATAEAQRAQTAALRGDPLGALLLAQSLALLQTSAGRDELADDDVLLEAAQVIGRAGDRRLGEHARGLLEGRRRQEAIRVERGFRHAQQDRLRRRRLSAFRQGARIRLLVVETIHQVVWQQISITGVVNAYAPEHLAHDDLDVLVVDIDTGRAVDLLYLLDEIHVHRLTALDAQDILRVDQAVGQLLSRADMRALADGEG